MLTNQVWWIPTRFPWLLAKWNCKSALSGNVSTAFSAVLCASSSLRVSKINSKYRSSNDRTCPSPPTVVQDYPKRGCALNWPHYEVSAQPQTLFLSWGRGFPDCTHNLHKENAGTVPSGTLPLPLESGNKPPIMSHCNSHWYSPVPLIGEQCPGSYGLQQT